MFEADPTFCFHFVNCFEVEEHLIVDLCSYDDIGVFDALCLKNDKSDTLKKPKLPPGTFRRYVLPINVTEVGCAYLCRHPECSEYHRLPNKVQWSALYRHTRVFRIPSFRTKSSGQRYADTPTVQNTILPNKVLWSALCRHTPVLRIPSPSKQSPAVTITQTHPSVQNTILPNKVQWSAICRQRYADTRVFRIPSFQTKSCGQRYADTPECSEYHPSEQSPVVSAVQTPECSECHPSEQSPVVSTIQTHPSVQNTIAFRTKSSGQRWADTRVFRISSF